MATTGTLLKLDVPQAEEAPAPRLLDWVPPSPDGWEGLLYGPDLTDRLRGIAARWRHRDHVQQVWGFERRVRAGGLLCLFAGASGAGKSAAASAIAGELGVPLFRVNVAGVMSKYVGETEKNLAQVLDAAEAQGAALLFDEADALFARRAADVKGSADLGHNQQVAYLLDRLERWHGLAFLTTNLGRTIDAAFRRRFHVILDFDLPDRELRARIWRLALARAPLGDDVDWERLARPELSGGLIQKAALNAAYAARSDGAAVGMRHLQAALEDELHAAGRLVYV